MVQSTPAPALDVSVVVLVSERPDDLESLYREHSAALAAADLEFEFIFACEPWATDLIGPILRLREEGEPIRVVVTGQTVAEAELFKIAAERARSDVLLSIPAYPRVDPAGLPLLLDRLNSGADVVVARRWPRNDSVLNRLQTRLLHAFVSPMSGGRLNDVASGVRVVRRRVLAEVPLYGDYSRFFPLFALREGYRVEEVAIPQHTAERRTRVYAPGIYIRRMLDLLGLFFLLRFTEKPLRFFGLVGTILAGLGGGTLLVLLAQRLQGQPLADRPMLVLSVLLFVLGVQAIALGLIGEIIVHFQSSQRRSYRIRDD